MIFRMDSGADGFWGGWILGRMGLGRASTPRWWTDLARTVALVPWLWGEAGERKLPMDRESAAWVWGEVLAGYLAASAPAEPGLPVCGAAAGEAVRGASTGGER